MNRKSRGYLAAMILWAACFAGFLAANDPNGSIAFVSLFLIFAVLFIEAGES